MTIQEVAVWISVAGILAIAGGFAFVLARSRPEEPYARVQPIAYALRFRFFLGLLVAAVAIAAWTLPRMPYARPRSAYDPIVVDVVAHQWRWEISNNSYEAGRPVLFRVTSRDVNHGFGIYDADRRMIAQVQAMPGYVNDLLVEFDVPGQYQILCLEYCGLLHHGMFSPLEVVAAAGSGGEGR